MFVKPLLALCLVSCQMSMVLSVPYSPGYQFGQYEKNGKLTVHCPPQCNYPKSSADCLSCLNVGVSQIVNGTAKYYADLALKGKLEPGGWHDWSGGQCWIYLKGVSNSDDCKKYGTHMFGDDRCDGFDGTDWRSVTKRCWVRFKQA